MLFFETGPHYAIPAGLELIPLTHLLACFSLPTAGFKVMHHHAQYITQVLELGLPLGDLAFPLHIQGSGFDPQNCQSGEGSLKFSIEV